MTLREKLHAHADAILGLAGCDPFCGCAAQLVEQAAELCKGLRTWRDEAWRLGQWWEKDNPKARFEHPILELAATALLLIDSLDCAAEQGDQDELEAELRRLETTVRPIVAELWAEVEAEKLDAGCQECEQRACQGFHDDVAALLPRGVGIAE